MVMLVPRADKEAKRRVVYEGERKVKALQGWIHAEMPEFVARVTAPSFAVRRRLRHRRRRRRGDAGAAGVAEARRGQGAAVQPQGRAAAGV